MRFVSELIGRPVIDADGERIGTLKDLVASSPPQSHHPKIIAIEVKLSKGVCLIPISDVMVLLAPNVILKKIFQMSQHIHPPRMIYT